MGLQYCLNFILEGQQREVFLERNQTVIGRDAGCDLVIPDITVSRQHARIVKDRQTFVLEDLGSRNGTKLNGDLLEIRTVLRKGDEITLGSFVMKLEERETTASIPASEGHLESAQKIVMDDSQWGSEGTIVRPIRDLEKFLEGDKSSTSTRMLEEENRILIILSQVARALISVEPLEDTLNKVMDLIFKHIKAHRGCLMLLDDSGELIPKVLRIREDADDSEEFRMSRTIAKKVLGEKVGILSSDVQADPRFREGDSIRIMGIQSAMCVPLWDQERVIGLVHVDTPLKETLYTERDLDLLAALANYAAVAIERSKLNDHLNKEKELKSRLERYHSPAVAARILEQEGSGIMTATEKEVTILFADMVGFTSLSQELPPGEVAKLLNLVFSKFTDTIFKYEGTLDKFLGDCVMAVFGAPIDHEHHSLMGVQAAFEMIEQLKIINKERPKDDSISFHFALNTGLVVAGDIGSPSRLEYTVLGSPVNLAARIQAVSPPNVIWVGPETHRQVAEYVESKMIGEHEFKGMGEKIPIYELISLNDAPTKTS